MMKSNESLAREPFVPGVSFVRALPEGTIVKADKEGLMQLVVVSSIA